MDIQTTPDIRKEIWRKFLIGNMTLSLLASLTGSTADKVVGDLELAQVARKVAEEGKALAARLGVDLTDLDHMAQLDPASVPKGDRPSMLQDLERGRPMEIDTMVTVVQDLAREARVDIPTFWIVAALLKQRAERPAATLLSTGERKVYDARPSRKSMLDSSPIGHDQGRSHLGPERENRITSDARGCQ